MPAFGDGQLFIREDWTGWAWVCWKDLDGQRKESKVPAVSLQALGCKLPDYADPPAWQERLDRELPFASEAKRVLVLLPLAEWHKLLDHTPKGFSAEVRDFDGKTFFDVTYRGAIIRAAPPPGRNTRWVDRYKEKGFRVVNVEVPSELELLAETTLASGGPGASCPSS
jgi:hypothetical protein